MSTYNVLFFLGIIVSSIFLHNKHARADDDLINAECHNADAPATCIKCVESDPRSSQADNVGIAKIVTTCLMNDAKTLQSSMGKPPKILVDRDVSSALKHCRNDYSVAQGLLSKADSYLGSKDFDLANSYVNSALQQYHLDCLHTLEKVSHKWKPSPLVQFTMTRYGQLSLSAMRIIDRL